MAITHNAVVAVPDDGISPVGSDEWNAAHTIGAGTVTDTEVAAANKDGDPATASMRTLGTGAAVACAGNDARLSDARQLAVGTDKTKLDAINLTFPYAIVVASGTTSAPSGVTTFASFGTTPFLLTDASGFYSASDPTRLTVPAGMAGLYQVVGCQAFGINPTGAREVGIRLNTATTVAYATAQAAPGDQTILSLSVLLPLAAGDYLGLAGWQNSGAALSLGGLPPSAARLSLCRLIKTT